MASPGRGAAVVGPGVVGDHGGSGGPGSRSGDRLDDVGLSSKAAKGTWVTQDATAGAVGATRSGLGWPERGPEVDRSPTFSTGLGWPSERVHPQKDPGSPQAAVTSPAAEETSQGSRDTTQDGPSAAPVETADAIEIF